MPELRAPVRINGEAKSRSAKVPVISPPEKRSYVDMAQKASSTSIDMNDKHLLSLIRFGHALSAVEMEYRVPVDWMEEDAEEFLVANDRVQTTVTRTLVRSTTAVAVEAIAIKGKVKALVRSRNLES